MRGSGVERVGVTLHRPAHARSRFVANLLGHIRAVGFDGAPLALGFDDEGRQVFEWVGGDVPAAPPYRLTDEQLRAAALLVRGFHDAAASFAGLGDGETVEHGDLGPHNTVFRSGVPIAIIDWDADVRPGSRDADFAQAVWGYADLLEHAVPLERQGRGLGVMCHAYSGPDPARVLDELDARFCRAEADHAVHGRPRAVAVFEDLRSRLASGRRTLLVAAHGATAAGR